MVTLPNSGIKLKKKSTTTTTCETLDKPKNNIKQKTENKKNCFKNKIKIKDGCDYFCCFCYPTALPIRSVCSNHICLELYNPRSFTGLLSPFVKY
jgi:hypothetical protein